jgi:hypothetical protein
VGDHRRVAVVHRIVKHMQSFKDMEAMVFVKVSLVSDTGYRRWRPKNLLNLAN